MQIKYRITLVYTLIVTIIMLLLCWAIYFYSAQNREVQFKERLYNKAYSTALLLASTQFNVEDVKKINESGHSSLFRKSINVYTDRNTLFFTYRDPDALPLVINNSVLENAKRYKRYFFGWDGRDAVAIYYTDNTSKKSYTVIVASYDNDRVEWQTKLRTILAVCFVGSICIVIITGYIFSLGLVGSISSLTNRINRITSENFLQRLDTGSGRDELQQLGVTINNLLDRLRVAFDAQRRFIANASHELSTPLTAITSQLDVALHRERTNEEYKKIIKSIKDDSRRLQLLVKSLLEIAKASGSTAGIELSSVRIDELLMGLPTEMKKISKLYDVELSFEEFPDNETDCLVYGNMPLLYSAIKNIVHNACKFSTDKVARVTLSFASRKVLVTVRDKGPGIAPDDLEQIFQPFFRGYKQDNLIYGSGLGLALSKRIIELHKGDIMVETVVGEGSTFKIILPLENSEYKDNMASEFKDLDVVT